MTERAVRRAASLAAVSALGGAVVLGASISETLAQRGASQFAATEFTVSVAPTIELEGSIDGANWEDGAGEPLQLTFASDQMALEVGEGNAIYTPIYVRTGAASNAGARASVVEEGLGPTDFAASLRGELYRGAATCDPGGVASAELLTDGAGLRGQRSGDFHIPAPSAAGEPGETVELCVKVWLDNNNWLLGGTPPPTETATWTVAGTAA